MLAEYVAAMRALWTQPEAAYDGKFVSFGPCWAFPKPVQAHLPLIIGAGGGPRTFEWIGRHADGWLTTPGEQDIGGKAAALHQAWAAAGRAGAPDIRVLGQQQAVRGRHRRLGRGRGHRDACGACRTARPRRPRRTWTGWRAAWRPGGDAGG